MCRVDSQPVLLKWIHEKERTEMYKKSYYENAQELCLYQKEKGSFQVSHIGVTS